MPRRTAIALLAAALSLACGGSGTAPFAARPGTWSFVDVPGTSCSDGSPTGFGVSLGPTDDLLAFLDGGGACWDFATCFGAGTATPGPFGRTQMEARGGAFGGTFFDRSDAANPFRDWTYVFVPYCTGDLHAGDAVGRYSPGGGLAARTWVHKGRVNVAADLARLAAGAPAPRRLTVHDRFDPLPRARTFLVSGSRHALP